MMACRVWGINAIVEKKRKCFRRLRVLARATTFNKYRSLHIIIQSFEATPSSADCVNMKEALDAICSPSQAESTIR
jgi:hypothetical protein